MTRQDVNRIKLRWQKDHKVAASDIDLLIRTAENKLAMDDAKRLDSAGRPAADIFDRLFGR